MTAAPKPIDKKARPPGPKIIIIGLNKCGTTSLHYLFRKNKLNSIQWLDDEGFNIAKKMSINIALGRAPLYGYDNINAFSDMNFREHAVFFDASRHFRDLHRAYPNAYFILNIRPVDDWIKSRTNHGDGDLMKVQMKNSKLKRKKLLDQWRQLFARHNKEVAEYFKDNPKFLIYDILNDDPQAIVDLLAPHYKIDPSWWEQRNATPKVPTDFPEIGAPDNIFT